MCEVSVDRPPWPLGRETEAANYFLLGKSLASKSAVTEAWSMRSARVLDRPECQTFSSLCTL